MRCSRWMRRPSRTQLRQPEAAGAAALNPGARIAAALRDRLCFAQHLTVATLSIRGIHMLHGHKPFFGRWWPAYSPTSDDRTTERAGNVLHTQGLHARTEGQAGRAGQGPSRSGQHHRAAAGDDDCVVAPDLRRSAGWLPGPEARGRTWRRLSADLSAAPTTLGRCGPKRPRRPERNRAST